MSLQSGFYDVPVKNIDDDFRDNYSTTSRDEKYRQDIAFTMGMTFDDTRSVISDSDTLSVVSKDDIEKIIQQRVEEEVRKRVEATMQREESRKAEEAKQLAKKKEKQDLDDFYREIYARQPNLTVDGFQNDTPNNYKRSLPFFKHISSLGEKILFKQTVSMPQGGRELGLFLTNQNVYVLNYNINSGNNECYVLSVYTFNEPLNSKQAKMLYNHLNKHVPFALKTNFNQLIASEGNNFRGYNEWVSRQFEAVVRVIPGSFQNDDWQQLDGFFGVYYNEKTMEIDIFPGKVF
jgi:hypothetical protein